MKSEYSDKEMKSKLLDMVEWFHNFCKENDIRYYVIDGTMLGTARHHGFIPWDDDIDVGIPRKDYEKLAKLMKDNNNGKYALETPYSEAPEFIYTYSKLYDTTTTLVEHAKKTIARGIFLDIFPLDGLGNDMEEAKRRFRKINFFFYLYMSRVVAINPKRNKFKNFIILLVQLLTGPFINNKKMQMKIDCMCKELDFDECKICGNLLGTWRFRDVMQKSILGKPTEYPFEDTTVYGVEDYDRYLTYLYGNWRMPPPIEQQVSKHDFEYLNLNHAYRASK